MLNWGNFFVYSNNPTIYPFSRCFLFLYFNFNLLCNVIFFLSRRLFIIFLQVILTTKQCIKHQTELFWVQLEHLTAEQWIAETAENALPTTLGWLICSYQLPPIITHSTQVQWWRTASRCPCSWNICWFILFVARTTGHRITYASISITVKWQGAMAGSIRPIAFKGNRANWS